MAELGLFGSIVMYSLLVGVSMMSLAVIGLLVKEIKNIEVNNDQNGIYIFFDHVFLGLYGLLLLVTIPYLIALYPYAKYKQFKDWQEYNNIQKDIKHHESIRPEGFIYLHPADEHELELYPLYDITKVYSPDDNVIIEGGVYHCYRKKDEKYNIDISDVFGG